MRKWMSALLAAVVLCLPCTGALAAGVTLQTYTPFADMDFASQAYMDAVTAWEAQTGNVVEDFSGLCDETWLAQLRKAASAGKADVVIVPVGSGLTREQLVTAEELREAAPELGARALSALAEKDGSILLTPVRLNWEALYINTDVLEAAGLAVPTTLEELVAACEALAKKGVTPIANALNDWAEVALDCAALISAPAGDYGKRASQDGARDTLAALVRAGAFGTDPWNAKDEDAQTQFLSGKAAMRFDADTLAAFVPAERADSVRVATLSATPGAVAGTPSFGLAITRACWNDAARREAALSLAQALLGGEAAASLVCPAQGALGQSVYALTAGATDCAGLLYDFNSSGFDNWAKSVVTALKKL